MVSAHQDQRGYDIVRNYWLAQWGAASGEKTWRRCLHDGLVPDTAYIFSQPNVDPPAIRAALKVRAPCEFKRHRNRLLPRQRCL